MFTAEQLRAARAMLGLGQAELAKISGVSVETIKRLESQTGMLQAKDETLLAIKKEIEAQGLQFTGNRQFAGVQMVHPNQQRLLRKALIEKWGESMDQLLDARCATDPHFFQRGERHLTEALTNMSTGILPTIVRDMLSEQTPVSSDTTLSSNGNERE